MAEKADMSGKKEKPSVKTVSEAMKQVLQICEEKGGLTVEQVMDALGRQAVGILILLMALPNCIPIPNPPGLSGITGIPVMIVAGHYLLGIERLWLPERVRHYRLKGRNLQRMLQFALPYMQRIEHVVRPRWEWVFSRPGRIVTGAGMFLLALMMALPIPWGNFIPGVALAIMAVGLLERDGIVLTIGLLGGMIAAALFSTMLAGLIIKAWKGLAGWF